MRLKDVVLYVILFVGSVVIGTLLVFVSILIQIVDVLCGKLQDKSWKRQ